jgi:hypothetical protein
MITPLSVGDLASTNQPHMQLIVWNHVGLQHNNYVFHEQFETTTSVTSFIEENSPAVQRLSRDFAGALVSDILESF